MTLRSLLAVSLAVCTLVACDKYDNSARVNWGGSWRVPTYAELMEFLFIRRPL